MQGGATTPHQSTSCLYHEALLSHVARTKEKISRTDARAVKSPTHMGATQFNEQGRAQCEGVVKSPAPRTLRAMCDFAIKKSPPPTQGGGRTARGESSHAPECMRGRLLAPYQVRGRRLRACYYEPTQRVASYLAMREGLSPIHVMERSFAPSPLYTDSGAPMIRAMLQTVTVAISASTSSV